MERCKETFKLTSLLWGNQLFILGRDDATFKLQKDKGLQIIQTLYLPDSDIWMSFQDLQNKFHLDKKHFLKISSTQKLHNESK